MKKKKKGLGIVYAERIAPLVSSAVLMILMLIPSVQYFINSEKGKLFSLWELLGDSWERSRHYLFSSTVDRTSEGELFYTAVFAILVILFLIFIIGLALIVWSSALCLLYYKDKKPSEELERAKDIFTAVFPNRLVLAIPRLMLIPLALFPDILVTLYRKLLLYDVSLDYRSMHCGIAAVILFALTCVLTAVSSKYEKRLGMNIFSRKAQPKDAEGDEDYSEESASVPLELRRMGDSASDSQEERLRTLLGYSEDSDTSDTSD